jgi:peptidoglycan hydrolase-like protein with peptidoglycan-binding domain
MAMLQYGTQGMFVRDVQGLLYQAGLYNGRIDGYYGVKTEDAVKKWQNEIGAKTDGKWGPKTTNASSAMLAELNNYSDVTPSNAPVVPYYGGLK